MAEKGISTVRAIEFYSSIGLRLPDETPLMKLCVYDSRELRRLPASFFASEPLIIEWFQRMKENSDQGVSNVVSSALHNAREKQVGDFRRVDIGTIMKMHIRRMSALRACFYMGVFSQPDVVLPIIRELYRI